MEPRGPSASTASRTLARLYGALLDRLDLENVTVIGNSIGGWIAAEMALLGSPRIGGLVLVDAAGIEVEGHPAADFFSLSLDEVAQLSYHDPVRFRIDPSTMPEAQRSCLCREPCQPGRLRRAVHGRPDAPRPPGRL